MASTLSDTLITAVSGPTHLAALLLVDQVLLRLQPSVNGTCTLLPVLGFRQGRNAAFNNVVRPKSALLLVPSTNFAAYTNALKPRRECAQGTCQYYHSCKARKSSTPNHFCTLDNGFTGICCDQPRVQQQHPQQLPALQSKENRFTTFFY